MSEEGVCGTARATPGLLNSRVCNYIYVCRGCLECNIYVTNLVELQLHTFSGVQIMCCANNLVYLLPKLPVLK